MAEPCSGEGEGSGRITVTVPYRRTGFHGLSQSARHMGILKAIGLGLAILVLKFLVPEVFSGIVNALVSFFALASTVFGTLQAAVGSVSLPQ